MRKSTQIVFKLKKCVAYQKSRVFCFVLSEIGTLYSADSNVVLPFGETILQQISYDKNDSNKTN